MKNRKLTRGLALSALTLTTLIGVGATAVYASDTGTTPTSVQASTHTVQKHKASPHEGTRHIKLSKKLDLAVKEGRITSVQEKAVLEFQAAHQFSPNDDLTQAEREAERKARKAEFDAFAKANSIPTDILKPERGPRHEVPAGNHSK